MKHLSIRRAFPILSIALFLLPGAAIAQERVSIKIQPSLIEERVEPGQVLEQSADLTNFSSVEQTLYLSIQNVSGVTPDGQPTFAKAGEITPFDVSSWVEFSVTSVKIAPGETRKVPFTIRVPEAVGPGGHYGAVMFTQNPPELETSGTGVGYQLALLMNLRVSGEVVEDAQVREFVTDAMVYGKMPVKFSATVENPGNVIVRPRGPIDIVNMFGKKVDTIRMNDTAAAVFPGATMTFSADWESQDLHFGRYSATMVLAYGDPNQQNTTPAVTRFWVLPTSIIIPVIGFLIFFILITWILMRLYVARRLRELSSYSTRGTARGGGGMSRLTAVTIALLLSVILMMMVLFLFF